MKKQRKEDTRAMSAAKAAAGLSRLHGRVDDAVAAARLAEIPPDTRNLTQRIYAAIRSQAETRFHGGRW